MMTRSKRHRTLEQDGLSSLPDDTLTHILSFLITKQSVSTSILSTRWKHLFKSVPALHFDSSERWNRFSDEKSRFLFRGFVNKVLAVHNVKCIQSFRLLLHSPSNFMNRHSLISWISDAIGRNPQLLEVNIKKTMGFCCLSDNIFICPRLVHLKLTGDFVLDAIDAVCLPNLKTFYVSGGAIKDAGSVSTLFSNCPILEDLTLHVHYAYPDVKFLSINAPSLKRLTISCPGYPYGLCVWELNALNLEYINFDGPVIKWYSVTVLKSLREAYIRLGNRRDRDRHLPDDRLWELINKFHQVQLLSLSGNSMESLASDSCSLLMFNKLTTLELKAKYRRGWNFFATLLEKSPCLELLVIHETEFLVRDKHFPEIDVLLPKHIPLCFLQSLKEVKLCKFEGDRVEFQWIGYLLNNAMILEKLTVIVQSRSAYLERQSLIEKLFALPRSSNACQIMVRGPNGEIISEGDSGSMLSTPL